MDKISDDEATEEKKKRGRCKRGLAARLAAKQKISDLNQEIDESSSVYSTQVARILSNPVVPQVSLQCISDDESDDQEKVFHDEQSTSKPADISYTDCLVLDDDDEFECTPPEKIMRESVEMKSPSPPPPPAYVKTSPRLGKKDKQPSMTRAVKKAMKKINEAKSFIQTEEWSMTFEAPRHNVVNDVICLDDSLDENSVFFFVQFNSGLQKHRMGKWEPFQTLIEKISTQEKISAEKIILTLNDDTLRPSDTPHTVKLEAADIIRFYKSTGIVADFEENLSLLPGVQIFVQSRNSKKKLEFKIDKLAPLQVLINQYSIKTKTDPSHWRLQFDGEDITPEETADDLDLEDGFCLDIIEVS